MQSVTDSFIKSLIKQMLQYSLKAEFTESAYRVLRQ
jgi:hypothetical protein